MKRKLLAVLPMINEVMCLARQEEEQLDDVEGLQQYGGSGTGSTRSSPTPSDAQSDNWSLGREERAVRDQVSAWTVPLLEW